MDSSPFSEGISFGHCRGRGKRISPTRVTGVGGEGRGNNLYAFAFSENAGSKAQVKELILQKLPSDITAVA